MQILDAKSLTQYRLHARRLQALQRAVEDVLPISMHGQIQVAAFRQRRVCIHIDNAVLLLPLQGLKSRILEALRAVFRTIEDVDLMVRPLISMPESPCQSYQRRAHAGPKQRLSVAVRKQMEVLARRCQHRRLQASLRRMLQRYCSALSAD